MSRPRTRIRSKSKTLLPYGASKYKIRYCKLTGLFNVPAALTSKVASKIADHEEDHAVAEGIPSTVSIAVSTVCASCARTYREKCNDVEFVRRSALEMDRFAARSKGRAK